MSIELLTILLFSSLMLFLFLGLPLAFVLGGLSVLFIVFLWGPKGLSIIPITAFGVMNTIIMIALPLFVFMANVLERSGLADDLYSAMHRWFAGLRGGLAMGTVLICTIFAAMSGTSGAGTITMGLIALPAMLKRRYDKRIAIGCIMAGGALGPLIPPSIIMIIYGAYAEVSVGQLFAGGVFPGLVLSSLFCTYIGIRCFFQPNIGPPLPPEEKASWREKFVSIRAIILPALLILGVLGSIFSGAATPTEAASVGAFGSLLCAAIHRRLNWKMFKEAGLATLKVTCMVQFIVIGAKCFASVYTGLGAPELIENIMLAIPGGKYMVLAVTQLTWIAMGCFLDALGILMITGPIFIPVIISLGFDPVWFGVLFVVNMEMAFLTPPFGFNIFYMKGIVPKGITMGDIYRSIVPFVLLQFTGLVLVIVFPKIILWLPTLLFR